MTRSEIRENLLVALDTLRSRKVRSALTILGIVIGVTSVISVAAIIDGLNGYIKGRINTFGSRSLLHHAHSARLHGSDACRRRSARASTCSSTMPQYLKETVPGARFRHGLRQPHQLRRSSRIPSATATSTWSV